MTGHGSGDSVAPASSDGRAALIREFRRGWPILLACMIGHMVGVHILLPFTIGLFINPLQNEFGWSRTGISLGVTILTIGTAIAAPVFGMVADRVGERILLAFGMTALAAGYALLGAAGPSLAAFWGIMTLMALLGSGCSPVTLSRILVRTFERGRGTALGLTLIGTGLTGILAPLLITPVIAVLGWRAGYFALSLVMIICLPVMLMLLRLAPVPASRRGAQMPPQPRPQEAVDDVDRASVPRPFGPPFLRLLSAFFLIALATGGVVVHLVPMLIDSGYAPEHAGRFASLLGLSLLVSRLLTGVAADRLFAPRLATMLMGISAVGFALLAAGGPGLIPYVAVLMGLSLGAELDLIAYLTSRYVPSHRFGRVFGVLYAAFLCGVAASPLIYAQLYEIGRSYAPAFVLAAILLALSAALFATLPDYPDVARGARWKR